MAKRSTLREADGASAGEPDFPRPDRPPRRRGRALIAGGIVLVAAVAFFAYFQFLPRFRVTHDILLESDSKTDKELRSQMEYDGWRPFLRLGRNQILWWRVVRNPVDFDAYYHIKYSYILRTQGWQPRLPWLRYTIHSRFYRDHHLLFHVLLIPFTLGGEGAPTGWCSPLLIGAKLAGTLFPALMALAFWALLRTAQVPHPWLWLIGLSGASTAFLYRVLMPRPMAGALALLLVAAILLVKGRPRALGALTAVSVWYYDGYGMIVLLAWAFFIAQALVERRANWRPLAWCLAGAAAGIIVNPYFPRNVQSYIFNLHRSFSGLETRMGGGTEWLELETWRFVRAAPGAMSALLLTLVASRWRRRLRVDSVAFILMAVVGFLMACKARRYLEYFPPLAVVAAALTVRDLGGPAEPDEGAPVLRPRRRAVLVLTLLMAGHAVLVVPQLAGDIIFSQDFRTFRGAALEMGRPENSAPGDVVFNLEYDDFPQLFFYNHRNHYVVGLDPLYLYNYDPCLFFLWRAIGAGDLLDACDILEKRLSDNEDLLAKLRQVRDDRSQEAYQALTEHFKWGPETLRPVALDLLRILWERKPLSLHYVLKGYFKARYVVMETRRAVRFGINKMSDPQGRLIQVCYADEFTQVYEVRDAPTPRPAPSL